MFGVVEIGRGEGTSDRHIDGKALVCPPKCKRYIPRPTSVNIAENMLLFHNGREHPFLRNSVHKISYTVVTLASSKKHAYYDEATRSRRWSSKLQMAMKKDSKCYASCAAK